MVKTWATHKTTETVLNNRWQLAADGGWQLVIGGGWRLAVGGPWGLLLRAVLNKKKIGVLKDSPEGQVLF